MACELYFDDVRGFREASSKLLEKARGVRRSVGASGGARCSLRLDFGRVAAVGGPAPPPPPQPLPPIDHSTNTSHSHPSLTSPAYQLDIPYMKEMDEITYWLLTRRAPCLMKYDLAKRKKEEAQNSKPQIIGSIHSISDSTCSPTPVKQKKLSILDDDSESAKEPKNVYFDTSNQQQNQHTLISSTKSDSGADPDFNIKRSSLQDRLKRRKLQKPNRSKIHKKNKIISSTPLANVRRSLRNSRKGLNDTAPLNSSFEMINEIMQNGAKLEPMRPEDKCQKLIDKLDMDLKQAKAALQRIPHAADKPIKVNGEFENLSDVSGFTANYIRSTKRAVKNGKKAKSKNCQNLLKDCTDVPNQGTLLSCLIKPADPVLPETSAESIHCHNANNDTNLKPSRVHRRTSLLKFMSPKTSKNRESSKRQVDGHNTSENCDSSLQSPKKMCLRYPRRRNTCGNDEFAIFKFDNSLNCSSSKTRQKTPRKLNNNNTCREAAKAQPRTRSRRACAAPPAGSPAAAAAPAPARSPRPRRSARDSLRDKSGFAACFSDSDDEKPLKRQKFFG